MFLASMTQTGRVSLESDKKQSYRHLHFHCKSHRVDVDLMKSLKQLEIRVAAKNLRKTNQMHAYSKEILL